MRQHLAIRADSDTRKGVGHVMRMLALAQSWKSRVGRVTFITSCESVSILARVQAEGLSLKQIKRLCPDEDDLRTTLEILKTIGEEERGKKSNIWMVTDGYHFDEEFHSGIRANGYRLMVMDDFAHLRHYHADVLLNQNIGAEQLTYQCERETKRLLGTSYTLLRPEFGQWREWRRVARARASKVLVTLGGSDPDGIMFNVIEALQDKRLKNIAATIIIGPANPNLRSLQETAKRSEKKIQLLTSVDKEMPQLMAEADVAISAGGSTCWELAFMGLPSITLVLAENQRRIAEGLAAVGVFVNFGEATNVSPGSLAERLEELLSDSEKRQQMSDQGRCLIDGKGAERVVAELSGKKMNCTLYAHSLSR